MPEQAKINLNSVEEKLGRMIRIDVSDLEKISEAQLLVLVLHEFQLNNPDVKEDFQLARAVGISLPAMKNYKKGNGFLGDERWWALEKETKTFLRKRWLTAKLQNKR